jgi:hypothetical protein
MTPLVELALDVGRRMGLTHNDLCDLEQVAFLHDVDPDFLRSVSSLSHLAPAVAAVGYRYDGRETPSGTKEEALPVTARIVTVCRAWLSMTAEVGTERNVFFALGLGMGFEFCPAATRALLDAISALSTSELATA